MISGLEYRRQKSDYRKQKIDMEGISNPSTVLRTGIEQGISNVEVEIAQVISRTGNQGGGYQENWEVRIKNGFGIKACPEPMRLGSG